MVYNILKIIGKIALWVFFKRIEVHRKNYDGPVIYACNHPNMLLDVLSLGTTCGRKVHFLAKATLFQNKIVGAIFRSCGVIPVYRVQDNPSLAGQNDRAFSSCFEVLEKGETIGIFPEGISHAEPRIMNLKTGIARIALGAEERNNFSLGVKIVPVGFNFRKREQFRSSVLIVYGEPIDLTEYIEQYKTGDQREVVKSLTSKIQKELKAITLNVENKEDMDFIKKLETLYRHEYFQSHPEKDRDQYLRNLVFKQSLISAYSDFHQTKPKKAELLKRIINNYVETFKEADVPVEDFVQNPSRTQALMYCLKRLPWVILGAPIAIYGIINNILPYSIPGPVAKRATKYLEEIATIKLLVGMIVFPIFYLLQFLVVSIHISWFWGAIYIATLPTISLITAKYLDMFTLFVRSFRIYRVLTVNEKLRQKLKKRKSLIMRTMKKILPHRKKLSQ